MTLLHPYRPAFAPGWVGVTLGWITAFATGVRGLDYATGPKIPPGVTLSVVESYGSTREWGCWMIAGFFALAAALLWRRIGPLIIAHLVGVGVYGWYGIALLQGVYRAGDGLRFVTPVAANLALHCVCLILLGKEVRRLAGPPEPQRPRVVR